MRRRVVSCGWPCIYVVAPLGEAVCRTGERTRHEEHRFTHVAIFSQRMTVLLDFFISLL